MTQCIMSADKTPEPLSGMLEDGGVHANDRVNEWGGLSRLAFSALFGYGPLIRDRETCEPTRAPW